MYRSGIVLLSVVLIFLFSYTVRWNSPVKGTVSPPDAALRVWLFSKTDTLSGSVISGAFQINNVKAGNYILLVGGQPPYKNYTKDGIVVVDGQLTDVGVINMQH